MLKIYKVLSNNTLTEIYIKDDSFYYLDNLIDINDFIYKNIKVDKKSYQYFFTDHIGYEVSDGVETFYIVSPKTNRYIKDDDGRKSKYLKINWGNEENKDIVKNARKYRVKLNLQLIWKNIMQICLIVRLNSDNDLPSEKKKLKICNLVIIIICGFNDEDDDIYYHQVFSEE